MYELEMQTWMRYRGYTVIKRGRRLGKSLSWSRNRENLPYGILEGRMETTGFDRAAPFSYSTKFLLKYHPIIPLKNVPNVATFTQTIGRRKVNLSAYSVDMLRMPTAMLRKSLRNAEWKKF
jgi:hypothetical protein